MYDRVNQMNWEANNNIFDIDVKADVSRNCRALSHVTTCICNLCNKCGDYDDVNRYELSTRKNLMISALSSDLKGLKKDNEDLKTQIKHLEADNKRLNDQLDGIVEESLMNEDIVEAIISQKDNELAYVVNLGDTIIKQLEAKLDYWIRRCNELDSKAQQNRVLHTTNNIWYERV